MKPDIIPTVIDIIPIILNYNSHNYEEEVKKFSRNLSFFFFFNLDKDAKKGLLD